MYWNAKIGIIFAYKFVPISVAVNCKFAAYKVVPINVAVNCKIKTQNAQLTTHNSQLIYHISFSSSKLRRSSDWRIALRAERASATCGSLDRPGAPRRRFCCFG